MDVLNASHSMNSLGKEKIRLQNLENKEEIDDDEPLYMGDEDDNGSSDDNMINANIESFTISDGAFGSGSSDILNNIESQYYNNHNEENNTNNNNNNNSNMRSKANTAGDISYQIFLSKKYRVVRQLFKLTLLGLLVSFLTLHFGETILSTGRHSTPQKPPQFQWFEDQNVTLLNGYRAAEQYAYSVSYANQTVVDNLLKYSLKDEDNFLMIYAHYVKGIKHYLFNNFTRDWPGLVALTQGGFTLLKQTVPPNTVVNKVATGSSYLNSTLYFFANETRQEEFSRINEAGKEFFNKNEKYITSFFNFVLEHIGSACSYVLEIVSNSEFLESAVVLLGSVAESIYNNSEQIAKLLKQLWDMFPHVNTVVPAMQELKNAAPDFINNMTPIISDVVGHFMNSTNNVTETVVRTARDTTAYVYSFGDIFLKEMEDSGYNHNLVYSFGRTLANGVTLKTFTSLNITNTLRKTVKITKNMYNVNITEAEMEATSYFDTHYKKKDSSLMNIYKYGAKFGIATGLQFLDFWMGCRGSFSAETRHSVEGRMSKFMIRYLKQNNINVKSMVEQQIDNLGVIEKLATKGALKATLSDILTAFGNYDETALVQLFDRVGTLNGVLSVLKNVIQQIMVLFFDTYKDPFFTTSRTVYGKSNIITTYSDAIYRGFEDELIKA